MLIIKWNVTTWEIGVNRGAYYQMECVLEIVVNRGAYYQMECVLEIVVNRGCLLSNGI